jgi:hypothetical protein
MDWTPSNSTFFDGHSTNPKTLVFGKLSVARLDAEKYKNF